VTPPGIAGTAGVPVGVAVIDKRFIAPTTEAAIPEPVLTFTSKAPGCEPKYPIEVCPPVHVFEVGNKGDIVVVNPFKFLILAEMVVPFAPNEIELLL